MPLLDQDLPARAQQGDENALAALIARMMPAIRKGAAECTAPGLDFDDAVQEGLICSMLCAGLTPLPGRPSRLTPRPASATRSRTPAGRLCAKSTRR